MKVVYEGPAPRQLVTLSLHGRTPTETVLSVFEGLGVNFALVADPSGARVQTLVVAGTATASSSPSSAASGRLAPRRQRAPARSARRPGRARRPIDPAFEEADEEPVGDEEAFAGLPPGAEVNDPSGVPMMPPDPALANPGPQVPQVPPPGPAAPAGRALLPVAVHAAATAVPAASARGAHRRRPEPAHRTERHAAHQPAAAVSGGAYGRVVGPGEGDRGVGKALPGRGIVGPTGRPTTRG